ncbi:MAG: twin-arginine translocation signal domain-containing protein, partial [Caldilineaceae bacterium SB0670_bin_27]|nr:twin-arginine translocation signal domain-containing protein [Caldilineaceae bacterium SB0670_bin_27]
MSQSQDRNESLLNRRDLIKLGGGAAVGAALLGACAPVSTPEEQPAAPAVVCGPPAALLPSGCSAELEWWTHTAHDT